MSVLQADIALVSMSRAGTAPDLQNQRQVEAVRPCERPMNIPKRALRSFIKGFFLGTAGNAAYVAFMGLPALLGAAVRARGPAKVLAAMRAVLAQQLLQLGHLHMGVWVGALSSALKLVGLLLEGPNEERAKVGLFEIPASLQRWRGAMLGVASGLCCAAMPQRYREWMPFFTLIRAAEMIGRRHAKIGNLPTVDQPELLLMMASSGVAMWSWIFRPELAVPSYLRFLNSYSGTSTPTLRAVEALLRSPPRPLPLEAVAKSRARLKLPPVDHALLKTPRALQALVFPRDPTNLAVALAKYWTAGFLRALPIYTPIFVLWKSLFNPRRFVQSLTQPRKLGRIGFDIARASAFLTTYTTLGWGNGCLLYASGLSLSSQNDKFFSFMCGACGCGLAVVIEQAGRRMELAMYVAMHAVQILLKAAAAKFPARLAWLTSGGFHAALTVASHIAIMQLYVDDADVVRRTYRRSFDAVLGGYRLRGEKQEREEAERKEKEEAAAAARAARAGARGEAGGREGAALV